MFPNPNTSDDEGLMHTLLENGVYEKNMRSMATIFKRVSQE